MMASRLPWSAAALALGLLASGCTDGLAPDPMAASIGLSFSLQSGSGSAEEGVALAAAFDEVDRYAVRVVDRISQVVYFDGVIEVTPGGEAHLLRVELPDEALGKVVDVTLIARRGSTELFRSEVEITVTSTFGSGGVGGGTLQAIVPIRYTGPGLRGSVTDAAGAGIGGVTVTLLQSGATVDETITGTDGSFLFTDLAAGTYVVRPTAPAGSTACPAERTVTMGTGDAQVAAFLFRAGDCITRLLVLSGGDVDDTETAAALFTGLADVTVERFFVVNATPTLEQLRRYDVVLVFQNGLFQESEALGEDLASFASLGGNLVFGSFFWQGRSDGTKGARGWGALEALDPFANAGGATYAAAALGTVASHAMTAGVTTLASTAGLGGGVSAKTGTTVVASWSDGTPLVGYQTGSAGQRYVSVSLFPAHAGAAYCCVTGDFQLLWQNVVRWSGSAGGPAGAAVLAGGR